MKPLFSTEKNADCRSVVLGYRQQINFEQYIYFLYTNFFTCNITYVYDDYFLFNGNFEDQNIM